MKSFMIYVRSTETNERESKVPIKSASEQNGAASVQAAIKSAMKEMRLRNAGELFQLLYGREGTDNEVQTLRNRLNRGNPGADFLRLCVLKMPPLQKLGVVEFFGINQPVE